MRQPIVILALTVAPAFAAAQAQGSAEVETRAQAGITVERGESPRIPGGFSAETRARLEAMIETARRKSLPAEPMTDRIAEGRAKGASESQIVAATATTMAQLELSQSALIRAGREPPSEEEVARGAQIIARGASTAQLTALAGREPSERRLEVALETLTELIARGVPVDRALAVIGSVSGPAGIRLGAARKPYGARAGDIETVAPRGRRSCVRCGPRAEGDRPEECPPHVSSGAILEQVVRPGRPGPLQGEFR